MPPFIAIAQPLPCTSPACICCVQVGRVLAWQAPPRRFFAWWCGGMNVQDLLVLAFVLAFNLWYFIYYYTYYGKQLDAGGWRGPSSLLHYLPALCGCSCRSLLTTPSPCA